MKPYNVHFSYYSEEYGQFDENRYYVEAENQFEARQKAWEIVDSDDSRRFMSCMRQCGVTWDASPANMEDYLNSVAADYKCRVKKIKNVDIIICGRQAIDGDTAQVGPQVAEKLGIPQITYTEEIQSVEKSKITVKRRLERGVEQVDGQLPLLITVNGSAADCRPRNAKLIQKYKHAKTPSEKQAAGEQFVNLYELRPYLNLVEWSATDVNADVQQCGLSGSPTKVKKIESVVFQAKESKTLDASDAQIEALMVELITNHTLG